MKKTIGVLAHVDAGKTTFSEQLLFHTKSIKSLGRVDHQDAYLDNHELEKARGITIFSEQGTVSIWRTYIHINRHTGACRFFSGNGTCNPRNGLCHCHY